MSAPVQAQNIGHPQSLRCHWRVRPAAAGESRTGIVWNFSDSANYDEAVLTIADSRHTDAFGRESAGLVLRSVRDGKELRSESHNFSPAENIASAGISMMLELAEGATQPMLHVGVRRPDISLPVNIEPDTHIHPFADTAVDTLLWNLNAQQRPAAEYAAFADVRSLTEYIAASHDINECVWTYHDRDTDPLRVSLGGDYRLATVRDSSGGYKIVYLSGHDSWQPLRIKGRMKPTGFIGEYDLDWLDADGVSMGPDCSALISDGSLLTLRFPLYESTLRFRRADTR